MSKVLFLGAAAIALSGCVIVVGPDGFEDSDAAYFTNATAAPISEELPEINAIKAQEGTSVTVRRGDRFWIEMDDRASMASAYSVKGTSLKVECGDPCPRKGSRGEVIVTVPSLNAVSVSTGAELDVDDAFDPVDSLSISVSTGGELNARNLVGRSVAASASTGGTAEVSVLTSISGSASTGGSIEYWGEPTGVSVKKSTGGSVRDAD